MASVGGDYFGLDHDGYVDVPENISTVVDLFDTKGIDWREYLEDAPGPGFMAEGSSDANGKWIYVRKHKYVRGDVEVNIVRPTYVFFGVAFSPLISFQSITNNGSRLLKIVSFNEFQRNLRDQALPQYAHLSPNMLNDGHDTTLGYAASWTRDFLTPLLENDYFMEKTLILLTYDESETYTLPNRIVSLLLGGAVPDSLKGTTDDTFYTHYSILSTLENNWGLPHLGRYDVGANVFDLVAQQTGYRNHDGKDNDDDPIFNRSNIDLSLSYPGFFNSKHPTPIPLPNPYLTGPGGQGILQSLPQAWIHPAGDAVDTPYDGSGIVFDGQIRPPVLRTVHASLAPKRISSSSPFFFFSSALAAAAPLYLIIPLIWIVIMSAF